jgi:GrpB-like predicted nucleotidyltransferase (UPF0157 family)
MLITLAPYDPDWPAQFLLARQELVGLLDPQWLTAVEHVGSTAVPGLAAKPIIDILAGVPSLESIAAEEQSIRTLGYEPWFGAKGRVSYERRNSQSQPTHHLHLVIHDGSQWRDQLTFRDFLRASADEREAYESLKRNLAATYTDTRIYSEAKSSFVRSVLSRAAPPC